MNELLYLISTSVEKDKDGFDLVQDVKKQIFGEKKTVGRAEFYAAYKAGIKASAIFKINVDEYNNESLIEYERQKYKVKRTYEVDEYYVELTCEKVE